MSRFYGNMSGERGEVTKCGHKKLESHIRSYSFGIRTECHLTMEGHNEFRVYSTGGSNNSSNRVLLYSYMEEG
jgi:hypothetical protein